MTIFGVTYPIFRRQKNHCPTALHDGAHLLFHEVGLRPFPKDNDFTSRIHMLLVFDDLAADTKSLCLLAKYEKHLALFNKHW